MATNLKNLSEYDELSVPSNTANYRIAIVVAEWNSDVTFSLKDGAYNTLIKNGVKADNIEIYHVPGTFELTHGARIMAESHRFDAVIVIGCVIQGETKHFDFICQGVTQGITEFNIRYNIPFIYGVLTTNNQQQALDRAGGKHGNKGDEAAYTALKMIELKNLF